jgi:hypothetical protein
LGFGPAGGAVGCRGSWVAVGLGEHSEEKIEMRREKRKMKREKKKLK